MIDTHCHVNLPQFEDDFDQMLERAIVDGVGGFVNIGYDRRSAEETMSLVDKYPFFFGVVGLHPHDAKEIDDEFIAQLGRWLDHPRVIAVGEIGLDYYHDHSPRDKQREVFARMLRLARERNKPIVIHCRDAFDDVIETLRAEGESYRGIFHAFAGSPEEARTVLDLGFYLGIGGVATFKNSRLAKTLETIPADRIVLETDSPYLTPHPYRGRRNEPGYVTHVARAVAEVLGVSAVELSHRTTQNFLETMGLEEDERPSGVYKLDRKVYIHTASGDPKALEAWGADDVDEVVVCGFDEPLADLESVKAVASVAEDRDWFVRVNTAGQANAIAERDVTPELADAADEVVVTFYGATAQQHDRVARDGRGNEGFENMLDFTRKCVAADIDTVCEFIAVPKFNPDACRTLARDLGAQYDIRMYRS